METSVPTAARAPWIACVLVISVLVPYLPLGQVGRALAASPDGAWSTQGPGARAVHTMVHDSAHGRMIVFGGVAPGGVLTNDVWMLTLSGSSTWQRLVPAGTPPSARSAPSAIYDPVRNRVLVFGGGSEATSFADVWQLSLADPPTWSLLSPSGTPPSARAGQSAVYDPVRDRMVVFGGLGPTGYVNDVWALTLAGTLAWVPLVPTGSKPLARGSHSAIYDPIRDRMLTFGGKGVFGDFSDTWAFALSGAPAWSVVPATGTPQLSRHGHSAVYDAVRDRLLICDGSGVTPFFADVWSLSLSGSPTWTLSTPAGTLPLARAGAAAGIDPVHDRMILYGGSCANGPLSDVWSLPLAPGSVFSEITPDGPVPSIRSACRAIYDSARDRMVMFGGVGPFPTGSDAWALPLAGAPRWTLLAPTGVPPSARSHFTMVFDPVRERALVMCGIAGSALVNEVWALSLAGTPSWAQLLPNGTAPSARWAASAVYDPVRDRVLLFGGRDGSADRNDVWALALAGSPSWSLIVPSGTPPEQRDGHDAIYDPVRDRMMIFGGSHQISATSFVDFNDVWELSLGNTPAWTQLHPSGAVPSARLALRTVYDSGADRMLLFGGIVGAAWTNEVWALSLAGSSAWRQLTPDGPPPAPRYNFAAIHDPIRGRLVVFGGKVNPDYTNDVWSLWPSGVLSAPGRGMLPSVCELRTPAPNPGRGWVTLEFTLAKPGAVRLAVFDVNGRLIRTLLDAERPAGVASVNWDGTTDSLGPSGAGVFFVRLEAGGTSRVRRVVMLPAGH